MEFARFQETALTRIDQALKQQLALNAHAQHLLNAMEYSVFNGGKRVRPLLVYGAAQALTNEHTEQTKVTDLCAMAVEMIHAYSLVHDDLPAMDDDDLRRGKPTCHIAFDEATAILAGDALQTEAFSLLSQVHPDLDPSKQLKLINILANASGIIGMAGGQSLDLEAVDKQVDLAYLETMHAHKTGALIKASILMGAYCQADVSESQLHALETYAQAIGLAFQVQDDILDVISDTQTLGKQQGADAALNKPTYVSLLGLDGAKEKATALHQTALEALQGLPGNTEQLANIAHYIVKRIH
jgi:farnesyl diphosphate synthase/geranylgeranyl diphosphate synthase type II